MNDRVKERKKENALIPILPHGLNDVASCRESFLSFYLHYEWLTEEAELLCGGWWLWGQKRVVK